MSISYGWEKFRAALEGMAANPGSLQQRIGDAYVYSLIRIRSDEDLPVELRPSFEELKARLTRENAVGDEGDVAATVAKMSDAEAEELAHTIVRIHDQLCAMDARDSRN